MYPMLLRGKRGVFSMTDVKWLNIFITLSLAVGLISCATPDDIAEQISEEDLMSMPYAQLCRNTQGAVNYTNRQKFTGELERRNFTKQEVNHVIARSIKRGMRKLAAYCSWGFPSRENVSTGSWGVSTQAVLYGGTYLYFEDGFLSSWQTTK